MRTTPLISVEFSSETHSFIHSKMLLSICFVQGIFPNAGCSAEHENSCESQGI